MCLVKILKSCAWNMKSSVQRLAAYICNAMQSRRVTRLGGRASVFPDEEQLERLAQLFQVDSSELIDAKERSDHEKARGVKAF
ncbi:MAG: hypothetical protein ACLTDX_03010 [[Clostridium] innocuum]